MSRKTEENENEKRWLILRARVSEEKIKAAFRLFRKNGIEPILIKGWAAAREYPEKYRRSFLDIDLAVAPGQYETALELISGEEAGKLNIDLHCGLRHLDTVEWDKLFQNSRTELLDDVPIRILSPEDHLRVLCVHWLTDGGAYRERLLDILYLLQNNSDSFDWGKCFESVDDNRRDWILKTIAVVCKYHDLDPSKIPFAVNVESIPKWFIKALEREWASGTRLMPIHPVWDDKREVWKQIKKRLAPNAVQSTVLMEGKFDESFRLYYQVGSLYLRLKPSIKKTFIMFKSNFHKIFKRDV